jgi:hypothetical protein
VGFDASVTSTSSARRMPLLSEAVNVTGSSPARTPGVSRPVPALTPDITGGTLSRIVTFEPRSCVCTTSLAPSVQFAVRPPQQPAYSTSDGAVPWTTELCGESALEIVTDLSIGPAAPQ